MGKPSANVLSPNFGFLGKYDAVLVRHAALAERYVFDDPNSALIKIRQFGELLAQQAAAYAGIAIEPRESFVDILDKLFNSRVTNAQISQLFHGLRKAGNDAAHQHVDNRGEALHQLQMARKLAVWFHKSFGNDPNFKAGEFIPPPDPAEAEQSLRTELERLREALANTQQEVSGLAVSAQTNAQQRLQAESEAQRAYQDLQAAMELAAESEQQLSAERQQFQARLAELQAQVASTSAPVRQATIAHALQEANAVELDEVATRRIIDAQLRDAGWEADSQTLRYANGTRPVKGRNIAIAEWPTAKGPADYCLFVGLTPMAVVEAKRSSRDVAAAIEQSKRYSRGFKIDPSHIAPGKPWSEFKIPFLFSTNGRPFLRQLVEKSGIWFLDARRDSNHPRPLEGWYTPEGLQQLLSQDIAAADARLETEPTDYLPLRDYQAEAILFGDIEHNLGLSLAGKVFVT